MRATFDLRRTDGLVVRATGMKRVKSSQTARCPSSQVQRQGHKPTDEGGRFKDGPVGTL